MVADHVLLVSIGIDFGTSGDVPILTKAGIPIIGGEPLLAPELTTTDAVFFAGGSAGAFPAQDAYIGEVLHAKKVSILYTANPAGTAAATTFGEDLLIKAGVPKSGIKLVGASASATDYTPAVSAAKGVTPEASAPPVASVPASDTVSRVRARDRRGSCAARVAGRGARPGPGKPPRPCAGHGRPLPLGRCSRP